MVNKERVSRWLVYIGILALFGSVSQSSIAQEPIRFLFPLLLAVPYLYIQYQKGKKAASGA